MSITLKDIARKVGVHPSTVSRVLNSKNQSLRIPESTRKRIIQAAKEMNYQPNEMARGLRLKKTHTIGLVVPDISNPFFSYIAKSIELEADKKGYSVIICNSDENQDKEINSIELLRKRRCDGIIIAPVQDTSQHFKALKKEKYPFVFVDRQFEDFEANTVVTDNYRDAYRAVDYLIQLKHRKIGFISGRRGIYTIRGRLAGYKAALNAYSIPFIEEYRSGEGFSAESGYEATRQILSLAERPSALLVSGNLITIGALQAIHEMKLSIPADMSVIGFCDSPGVAVYQPPLTTIAHPLSQIGKEAFSLLVDTIQSKNRDAYKKIVLSTQFVIRNSTAQSLKSSI